MEYDPHDDDEGFDQSQALVSTQLVDESFDEDGSGSPLRQAEEDPAIWGRLTNAFRGTTMLLRKPEYSFGRRKKNIDVHIPDNRVSQVHCKLMNQHGTVYISDCGSSNGTYVNGSRQKINKDSLVRLRPGDSFSLVVPEKFDDQVGKSHGAQDGTNNKTGNEQSSELKPYTFLFQSVINENPFQGVIQEKYEPLGEIGKGTYASVWKARDKSTHETFAVKIVRRKQFMLDNPAKWADQQLEAKTLSKLNHPNVIKLHETYESSDALFMVMELVSGGELFDRLVARGTPYSESDARELARNLLQAIAYIHEKDIVHRDLKPENILLCYEKSNFDVKLADFGVAKEERGGRATFCGSLCYIAPEIQNEPGTATYGKSVDMWSLGIIMYIVFALQPPFDEVDREKLPSSVKRALEFKEANWLNVSPIAKDFISKLLQVDATQRLTAKDALQHMWITGETPSVPIFYPTAAEPTSPVGAKGNNESRKNLGTSMSLDLPASSGSTGSQQKVQLSYRDSLPPDLVRNANTNKRVRLFEDSTDAK